MNQTWRGKESVIQNLFSTLCVFYVFMYVFIFFNTAMFPAVKAQLLQHQHYLHLSNIWGDLFIKSFIKSSWGYICLWVETQERKLGFYKCYIFLVQCSLCHFVVLKFCSTCRRMCSLLQVCDFDILMLHQGLGKQYFLILYTCIWVEWQ